MRKKLNLLLFTLTIIPLLFLATDNIYAESESFHIDAKSALLMDVATGKILYEKNIHEKLAPASITKIMTMLLTMEAIENNKITLQDQVLISERASHMGGTQLYLEAGESKTVEELMKGIAIRSANDASVAIGEHIAGSEELFVEEMNRRARELGMENTNFVNTNGLDAEGHVTTAYDVALMSRELLKHEKVKKWLTTWMDTVVVGKKQSEQSLVNTNRLIRSYSGISGIKTGYTSQSLHCISASATREDTSFISVVMAAPSSSIRFNEAAKLLDYGFANYRTIPIVKKDDIIGSIKLNKGKEVLLEAIAEDDLNVLVQKGKEADVEKEIIIPQSIQAPILKGDRLGEAIALLNGKEVGKVDIIAKEDVKKASIIDILGRMFNGMMGK